MPWSSLQSWTASLCLGEAVYNSRKTHRCTGGQKPRDYQDERFSYVALKRGPRAGAVGTRITRSAAVTEAAIASNAASLGHPGPGKVRSLLCLE